MPIEARLRPRARWARALLGLSAVLGAVSACASIVGIEETTVTRADGSMGGSSPGGAASAGAEAGGVGDSAGASE